MVPPVVMVNLISFFFTFKGTYKGLRKMRKWYQPFTMVLLKRWTGMTETGILKEHREKLMEQERGAIEQIQKAKKLEQGWVLMRMCRGYIQENSKT